MNDEERERDRKVRYILLQEENARRRASTPVKEQVPAHRFAHRCNDRWEDVLRSLTRFKWGKTPELFGIFIDCMRAEEGKEKDLPYTFLSEEEHAERERERQIGIQQKKDIEERMKKRGREFR